LEFALTATEYFNPTEHRPTVGRHLVTSKEENYLLRVSPTYYKLLNKSEVSKEHNECDLHQADHAHKEDGEDNSCYICCGKDANGVILDCGHGGICYDCLTDCIKQKDECMECRKKINTVVKIEKEVIAGKIFQCDDVCKIVRTEHSH